MRLLAWLLGVALALSATQAEARMHAPYRGHRIVPPLTGVLDGIVLPYAAFGFRKLRTAYAGPAVRLVRDSDSGQQDIGFVGNDFDSAAAAGFCAATPCRVRDWYDQSGLGHAVGTNPYSPLYVANCVGGKPCARSVGGGMVGSPQVTPQAVTSYAAVGRSTTTATTCYFLHPGTQSFGTNSASANWLLYNVNGPLFGAAPHAGIWHAGSGVIAGAASVISIDGVDTTGTLAAVVTPDWLSVAFDAGDGGGCDTAEMMFWNGYALTPAERVALANNQRTYWGI
jgi:hypothetical protein